MKIEQLNAYRCILMAEDWQNAFHLLPTNVSNWLSYSGSLTQKLQQISTDLKVELIQQFWQQCHFASASSNCWVREVCLKNHNNSWIFAQTIVPQSTIDNVAQSLLTLGEQPIGLWLFPQCPMRLSLECRQDPITHLYARRSQLILKGYPLEIRELFLADFPFD